MGESTKGTFSFFYLNDSINKFISRGLMNLSLAEHIENELMIIWLGCHIFSQTGSFKINQFIDGLTGKAEKKMVEETRIIF